MDIFAHTLWTAAAARGVNTNKKVLLENKAPLSVGWSAFWGVFPDLFAFGLPFIAALYFIITGKISISEIGSHHGAGLPESASWIASLPPHLYQISHSAVIFAVVFLVVWAVRRRPYLELSGWLLHILIDIPSHTASFYPTPFLWPISNYHFLYGVSWANPTYMIVNYSALAVVYLYFLFRKKKQIKA